MVLKAVGEQRRAVNEERFKPWFGKAGGMLEYRLDNGLKYTVGRILKTTP